MIETGNRKLCENCFAEIDGEPCSHCGYAGGQSDADRAILPPGTKLNDRILIGRLMGKGGFGITYLGYDLRMDKVIAVKEYYPNGIAYRAADGVTVKIADTGAGETFEKGAEKFYSEAQMVAQFNGNPNIVSVYDYFRANNTVYLVMEYLRGITLKDYVRNYGRLTEGQVLYVLNKMAAALSITHSAGVLHRDISPDNIMLCTDGKVKLIDFGAARQIMAESSANLTVVLKPGYTPVEQYTKKGRQGAWTDIYSLGVSLYYALTGVVLDDPYERMEDDKELEENDRGINADLWTILKKCTMISAADRYNNAIELRKALAGVSEPVKPEPVPVDPEEISKIGGNNAGTTETLPEAKQSGPDGNAQAVAGDRSGAESAEKETEDVCGGTEETEQDLTADLPVDDAGYDPAVNVYRRADAGKRKKRIILCTAAVFMVLCVTGVCLWAVNRKPASVMTGSGGQKVEPVTVEFSGVYGGFYQNHDLIPKEKLQSLAGDVLVTLDIETGNWSPEPIDGETFLYTLQMRTGMPSWGVPVDIVDADLWSLEKSDGVWTYHLEDGSDHFSFIISEEEIAKLKQGSYEGELAQKGLFFSGTNVIIHSARLEAAEQDPEEARASDYETGSGQNTERPQGSESVTVSFDKSFDHLIPKETLEAFGDDVMVTVNIEMPDLPSEPADGETRDYVFGMRTGMPERGVSVDIVDADLWLIEKKPGDDRNQWNYHMEAGSDHFTFIISREEIEGLEEVDDEGEPIQAGLYLRGTNMTIRSARLGAVR